MTNGVELDSIEPMETTRKSIGVLFIMSYGKSRLMNRMTTKITVFLILFIFIQTGSVHSQDLSIGLFEKNADIGDVGKPGSVEYDKDQKSYTITGGGENMWATKDALHFVWKQVSGDISLASDIS